ncbi:MAG: group II intron reverse transcriptase/maturase [Proteobacteria bacterium]|nr:group II intron reverse transcriptase/maturase [Pseudomonadota bacterium]
MHFAWRQVKHNRGAAGVDRVDFEKIEQGGLESWLGKLRQELMDDTYLPDPLLRVWIPKANGGRRPLSIPTIRDRVAQMCWYIVCAPIFEADMKPQQFGFRPRKNAKEALRQIYWNVTKRDQTDIIDADLKDYFNTIPHHGLLRSVARRIVDGKVLGLLKLWITAGVLEVDGKGRKIITTVAKDSHRGSGQGSVISPLLANIYFRRFILAWVEHGYEYKHRAFIVNYADDFVICCHHGRGKLAMQDMRRIIEKIGLTINEEKTRVVSAIHEPFDFLGYRFGLMAAKDGRRYFGTKPSPKSIKKIMDKIHDETSTRWITMTGQSRVDSLNPILRGWKNYFDQGPVLPSYQKIERYTYRRLQRFLAKKHKLMGLGYKQFPEKYLHEELGLYRFPRTMAEMTSAKT